MSQRTALGACAALLVAFTAISWHAVVTKSATFDEPLQSVAGWLRLHRGDFRLNVEDPPLWEEWAALPNGGDALHVNFDGPEWRQLAQTPGSQWRFVAQMLWKTPGVDGARFITRSRAMMLFFALTLGVLVALWSWRLAGATAAVISTALYAVDPNFLAHAALIKNDVAASAALLGISFLVWRIGQRVTAARVLGLVVVSGLALSLKYSCLLFGPIAVVLLGLRALLPEAWPVFSGTVRHRAAFILLVIPGIALVSWGATWASYDFRFRPAPEADSHVHTKWIMDHVRNAEVGAANAERPLSATIDTWTPDLTTRVWLWVLDHHLLPEAYANGFLFTYATALFRKGFLFDRLSSIGFPYYFPAAMLMKTPVATLLAIALAACVGLALFRNRRGAFSAEWAAVCVVLPPTIYMVSSVRAHMNIGIRHVLPIYPFVYVACGVVAAAAIRRWSARAVAVVVVLLLASTAESLAASPNFIPFFNVACGGTRRGVHLLGDSNLDWGQDLPLLAEWQAQHASTPLYLSYFGLVDPTFYGLRYRPLPANYLFGPPPDHQPLQAPCVVAVSASHLQGISVGVPIGDRYRVLLDREPMAVLGGSIFLYDVPDAATAAELSAMAR
jgi:hypothetical protein